MQWVSIDADLAVYHLDLKRMLMSELDSGNVSSMALEYLDDLFIYTSDTGFQTLQIIRADVATF